MYLLKYVMIFKYWLNNNVNGDDQNEVIMFVFFGILWFDMYVWIQRGWIGVRIIIVFEILIFIIFIQ